MEYALGLVFFLNYDAAASLRGGEGGPEGPKASFKWNFEIKITSKYQTFGISVDFSFSPERSFWILWCYKYAYEMTLFIEMTLLNE